MASARTECPECGKSTVVDLFPLLISPRVEYFRCDSCFGWWMVPKGEDGPVTRILLGNMEAVRADARKVG
jgi:hypothetical protein